MKYLYCDIVNGIMERNSIETLKAELLEDERIAKQDLDYESNNPKICTFKFYNDENDFYDDLSTRPNFMAGAVTNKMYEKIKSEYGICPF